MPEFRSVAGELKLLRQENEFIFPVELWMLNDSVTRNGWQFVNLEQHRAAWAGVPILVAYVNSGRTVGSGHNQRERIDPQTGEKYQSFTDATAERIVGAISENPADIRLVERDGYTWVVGKGFLWAWYARELVSKITDDARQGRTMSVSIEAFVTKERMEGDVAVEEEYKPLGVTVLGDRVDPAVVDAHIAMLSEDSEMGEEFRELKLRAASYIEKPGSANKQAANSEQKGMKKHMRLSKQQLRELQGKFGEYDVKAGVQNESGFVIALASKGGVYAVYRMASLDEAVYPDKIEKVPAQVRWCADGCDELEAEACDMYEGVAESAKAASERAECAEKELAAAKDTIRQMEAAESARRVKAAGEKAKATLAAFNANREDKVSEDAIKALCADIEAGKFTACEDESRNWTGESAVEEKVLSLCAAAVMELDKSTAQARAAASKSTYIWDKFASGGADDGSIEALLTRKGISVKG